MVSIRKKIASAGFSAGGGKHTNFLFILPLVAFTGGEGMKTKSITYSVFSFFNVTQKAAI